MQTAKLQNPKQRNTQLEAQYKTQTERKEQCVRIVEQANSLHTTNNTLELSLEAPHMPRPNTTK